MFTEWSARAGHDFSASRAARAAHTRRNGLRIHFCVGQLVLIPQLTSRFWRAGEARGSNVPRRGVFGRLWTQWQARTSSSKPRRSTKKKACGDVLQRSIDPQPEHAVEAPPRLLHPRPHQSSAGSTARERAPRAPNTRTPQQKTEARESPYTHNEKHESEEVLRRRAFLRDASTFLRRRLEDSVGSSQLPVQF